MSRRTLLGALGAVAALYACDRAGPGSPGGEDSADAAPSLAPADLAARIAEVRSGKVHVLHVGPRTLWREERIPGSRWVGEAGKSEGLQALAAALGALPPDAEVVVYCGCCPVAHCPNIRPARRALAGRPRASVLDLPTKLKTDWTDKGFPVERGAAG